jgi:hypothetical protein
MDVLDNEASFDVLYQWSYQFIIYFVPCLCVGYNVMRGLLCKLC